MTAAEIDVDHAQRDTTEILLQRMCLLYSAVLPFDIVPIGLGRSGTAPAAALLLLAWLNFQLHRPRRLPVGPSIILVLYLLGTWLCATLLWTANVGVTTSAIATLAVQIFVMIALADGLPGVWQKCLAWFGHGTSLVAIWVLMTGADRLRGGRAQIAGVDENMTAMSLAIGFAAVLYLISRRFTGSSILRWLEFVLIGAAILHVGSRTGLVAIGAVLALGVVIAFRGGDAVNRTSVIRIAVVFGVCAVGFRFLASTGLVAERLIEFLGSPNDQLDSARADIVSLYLRTQGDWYLTGVGYGADAAYLRSVGDGYQNVHSLFWKTWVETGFVGLALMALLLLSVGLVAVRRPTIEAVVLMSAPLAVFAVTLGGDRTSPFWFVLAFGVVRANHESHALGGRRRPT